MLATARSLGEFGAVVVSGKISGQTETLPIFVEAEYTNFNLEAYAAAILLALLAVFVLVSMNLLRRKPGRGRSTLPATSSRRRPEPWASRLRT